MAILFACGCGQQLWAKEQLAGQRMKCPGCRQELIIPDAGTAESVPDAPEHGLAPPPGTGMAHFRCTCGQALEAQTQFVGKRTRCPGCGEMVVIREEIDGVVGEPGPTPPPRGGTDSQFAFPGDPSARASEEASATPGGKSRPRKRKENPWVLLGGIAAVILIAGGLAVWIVFWVLKSDPVRRQVSGEGGPPPANLPPGGRGQGPAPRPLPTDVSLVPEDALAVLSLRLADFWKSESGREIQKNRYSQVGQIRELEYNLGRAPEDIERLTLVLLGPEPDSLLAMVTPAISLDPDKVSGNLLLGGDFRNLKGQMYLVGQGRGRRRALHIIHPRLYCFGSENAVREYLRRAPQTEAKNRWSGVGPGNDKKLHLLARSASGAEIFRALDPFLKGTQGQHLQSLIPLRNLRMAHLKARLGSESTLEITLTFAGDDKAEAGLRATRAALDLAKETLPDLNKALQPVAGAERARAYCQSLETGLTGAAVTRKGKVVTLSVRLKTDWAKIVSDAMDGLNKTTEPK
jgi:hypothetical protein